MSSNSTSNDSNDSNDIVIHASEFTEDVTGVPSNTSNASNTHEIQDHDEAMIPCEFCNEMVQFSEYENHLRPCSIRSTMFGQDFLVYRDEDTHGIYRINIGPAIAAFQNIGISSSNLDDDDVNGEEEGASDEHHTSIIMIPQIIPTLPMLITPSDSYAFNLLISDVIGNVVVGITNVDEVLLPQCAGEKADDVCPICQDAIPETQHVKTLCKHSYCDTCIRHWLAEHTTCPVCNQDQRELKAQ